MGNSPLTLHVSAVHWESNSLTGALNRRSLQEYKSWRKGNECRITLLVELTGFIVFPAETTDHDRRLLVCESLA